MDPRQALFESNLIGKACTYRLWCIWIDLLHHKQLHCTMDYLIYPIL